MVKFILSNHRQSYQPPLQKQSRPPAKVHAGRGSALCCLRCPPRHVHGEAGQVMTVSVNSIAVTGIWAVNERLESELMESSPESVRRGRRT